MGKLAIHEKAILKLEEQLDGYLSTDLGDIQGHLFMSLSEKISREDKYLEALHEKYEYLVERDESTSKEDLVKALEEGVEAAEMRSNIITKAKYLAAIYTHYLEAQSLQAAYDDFVDTCNPILMEFETECHALQKRLSTYKSIITPFKEHSLDKIRDTFTGHINDLAKRLTEAREGRAESKAEVPPPSHHRPSSSKLKLELPTFSGHPTEWQHFYHLFTSALERAGSDFSDRERSCFLLKAMVNSEAAQIVKSYSMSKDGCDRALKALERRYGTPKKIDPHLVKKMTSCQQIQFSQEGFTQFREKFVLPLQAMSD